MTDGAFLKAFIESVPIKIETVVDLTGIKRATIYTHFKKEKLDYDVKKRYQDGIKIDFSKNTESNSSPNVQYSDSSPPSQNTLGERSTSIIKSQTSIERFVSPEHEPIPVYDNTYGIDDIGELLQNESVKPTVLIMKGHLGCNLVVRHSDAAMNNVYEPKSQLGIQRVEDFKEMIISGMAAIIVLKGYTITRYVYPGENEDEFILRSADREHYTDMVVKKDKIKSMWMIKSSTPVPVSEIFMY